MPDVGAGNRTRVLGKSSWRSNPWAIFQQRAKCHGSGSSSREPRGSSCGQCCTPHSTCVSSLLWSVGALPKSAGCPGLSGSGPRHTVWPPSSPRTLGAASQCLHRFPAGGHTPASLALEELQGRTGFQLKDPCRQSAAWSSPSPCVFTGGTLWFHQHLDSSRSRGPWMVQETQPVPACLFLFLLHAPLPTWISPTGWLLQPMRQQPDYASTCGRAGC